MLKVSDVQGILRDYRDERQKIWDAWKVTQGENLEEACGECRCASCCYQLVFAHPVEGILIAMELQDMGRFDVIQRAFCQGNKQQELWVKSLVALEGAATVDETYQVIKDGGATWLAREEPCAFLEHGECLIYPVRPSVCATHFAKWRCKTIGPEDALPEIHNDYDCFQSVLRASDRVLEQLTHSAKPLPPVPLTCAVTSGVRLLSVYQFAENAVKIAVSSGN